MAKNLKHGFNRELLRDLREARGWTMDDLAQKLGVNCSQVVRWEGGTQKPRLHHLSQLAKIFNVSHTKFIIKLVEVAQ